MAELVTIARPYAEAVFRFARDKDNLPAWSDMLALVEAVVVDSRVKARIGDPNVSAKELEGLLLGVAGSQLDGAGRNLVQVLVQNDRIGLVPEIRALYETLRREHEGMVEVTIYSALPLSDEQTARLVARLEASHQRKVRAAVEVDKDLIGGVRIVVGDKVLDATVRGKLDAMAAALTH
ncbi:MAG: F0F1 ATP synthase subunit delta [Betaproteobacteria bacterium]|nr:F0F1 ATP synthase subunit delta [Betaproteobacteria bacterium]